MIIEKKWSFPKRKHVRGLENKINARDLSQPFALQTSHSIAVFEDNGKVKLDLDDSQNRILMSCKGNQLFLSPDEKIPIWKVDGRPAYHPSRLNWKCPLIELPCYPDLESRQETEVLSKRTSPKKIGVKNRYDTRRDEFDAYVSSLQIHSGESAVCAALEQIVPAEFVKKGLMPYIRGEPTLLEAKESREKTRFKDLPQETWDKLEVVIPQLPLYFLNTSGLAIPTSIVYEGGLYTNQRKCRGLVFDLKSSKSGQPGLILPTIGIEDISSLDGPLTEDMDEAIAHLESFPQFQGLSGVVEKYIRSVHPESYLGIINECINQTK
ncbi:MAG: hypothetical protein ACMXYC_04780 [Candidatus Woesearchaeota archaeon]